MGKLTDLLKSSGIQRDLIPDKIIEENKKTSKSKKSKKTENVESLDYNISDEDIEKVRAAVVEIDTAGKNRKQIIIGMFGGIKNPSNGKRFIIPGVDFSDEDYAYRYAEMMRTLVNKPLDFKKIMNWE